MPSPAIGSMLAGGPRTAAAADQTADIIRNASGGVEVVVAGTTRVTVNADGSVVLGGGTSQTIQTYIPSAAGTATLDLSQGDIHHITMPAGNITIAIANASPGQTFLVRILQDSVGSRTVTWFSTIRWAGGVAPTLTTTASKADTFGFEVTAAGAYDGFPLGMNI